MTSVQEEKVDIKDKKLLYELDFHARDSYAQLAKRVGLSKQGVEYKINNLQKKGIIKGFYPVVNVPKIGYLYCRLCLTLRNVTQEAEEELIKYLRKDDRFFWVFTTQGTYDVLVVMWAHTITEFKEAIEDLLSQHGHYIKSKSETLATDVIHFRHRYLLNKKDTDAIHITETKEKIILDEEDKKILKLLVKDARISLVKIAQELNMSAKTVSYRIKRLEKQKIIEGYRPLIDHNKLGYTYYKLWINIQYENVKEIKKLHEHIKSNPIVLYIVKVVGQIEDIDIEIMVKDNTELFTFIKDLRIKFPNLIGDYRTFMFIDTKKVRYLPF